MISTKKLIILGSILAAVIATIVIGEFSKNKPASKQAKPFFAGLTAAECSEIHIFGKTDTLRIFSKNGVWMAAGGLSATASKTEAAGIPGEETVAQPGASASAAEYPADTSLVSAMLTKIIEMKKNILVSQNPEKQETFQVDSVNGILVEVIDTRSKSRGLFRVGKAGPDYNSNYVRAMGSDDVWVVNGGLKASLYTDLKRWRDKSMISFDSSLVKELAVSVKDTSGKKVSTIRLSRSKDSANAGIWTITEPEKALAKTGEVSSIVGQFSSLKTNDWEPDLTLADSITGFDSPNITATAVLQNGESKTVFFGKKQKVGGKLYARVDSQKEIFLVYESSVKIFQKNAEELKEPPAPTAEPEPAAK